MNYDNATKQPGLEKGGTEAPALHPKSSGPYYGPKRPTSPDQAKLWVILTPTEGTRFCRFFRAHFRVNPFSPSPGLPLPGCQELTRSLTRRVVAGFPNMANYFFSGSCLKTGVFKQLYFIRFAVSY
jgi:hypothetical protein